jgi:hypothetical protein
VARAQSHPSSAESSPGSPDTCSRRPR